MPEIASIADVQSIAAREALRSQKRILGITASLPVYTYVPEENDPDAVLEFVVDVFLLEGPSQQVVLGLAGGLAVVRNVLIADSSIGDRVADLNVPVEIEKTAGGQLQVVGRARVALPTLRLDEYIYDDMKLGFLANTTTENGVVYDPFGYPITASNGGSVLGPRVSVTGSQSSRVSTLGELNKDDDGNVIGLGVNRLQRTIFTSNRQWEVEATLGATAEESRSIA